MTNEVSKRKPYNNRLGYVCSRKVSQGVYVVTYDNKDNQLGIDAQHRWVTVLEPKGVMCSSSSLPAARAAMKVLDWCN